MTSLARTTALAEVEARLAQLGAPAGDHPLQDLVAAAVGGGKLLRPRLVLAAAAGTPQHEVVPVAAAIELLHAALLVHDDLIDGDAERRGQPSVAAAATRRAAEAGLGTARSARVGLTTAVVAGDVLLVRALAELGAAPLPDAVRARVLAIATRSMELAAEGEHDDVLLAGDRVDAAQAERILERKTADYSFRAPLEIGAVLAGRSEEAIAALGAIGHRMGVVFQLRDDLLGAFGDPARTGKSTTSDLRAGAPTLLVALAQGTDAWRAVAADHGDPQADEAAAARMRAALEASGARAAVEARIGRECEAARAQLAAAPIEQELRGALAAILASCAERDR